MKILALEFSSELRSVAALDTETGALGRAEERGGRTVFAAVERALRAAALEREAIELLAVGLGPGSYTGIRGALAAAQGWQLALGAKVVGVSSVDCLAARTQGEGARGAVNIVIDAQRDEYYLARFEIGPESRLTVEELRLASRAEVLGLEGKGATMGPGGKAWFPFAQELYPEAATLARLAARRTEFASAEKLEPIYLRAAAFKKAPPPRVVR